MEYLDQVSYWHWWVLAIALIVLEALSPGVFFLWMGVAAAIVGVALLAFPGLAWTGQLLIFAVCSVISIVLWRLYLSRHPTVSDQPRLNRRGEQYVDRVFTLDQPVINGQGRIRVDDSTWKIRGEDCATGSRVRVVGVDGVVLLVELIDPR